MNRATRGTDRGRDRDHKRLGSVSQALVITVPPSIRGRPVGPASPVALCTALPLCDLCVMSFSAPSASSYGR